MSSIDLEEEPRFRSFYELARSHNDDGGSSSAMSESSVDGDGHVENIQRSWVTLQDHLEDVGRLVYEKVVNKNIEVATLFQDTSFESQHVAFMTMLGQSINWLSNMKKWHRKMTPLAQRHVNYGVKPQHYKHFRSAFLKAIREFLQDEWTEELEDAWIWYWGKIMDTLGHATQSNLQRSGLQPSRFAHYARSVHEVWQCASEDPQAFGMTFYQNLTASNPEMKTLFASSNLDVQSVRFFTMFNHAVRQLDDEAGFENAIIGLTFKHQMYGVEMHHVSAFGLALKTTLQQAARDGFTEDREEAWDWFWGRIESCFQYGLTHTHPATTTEEKDSNDDENDNDGDVTLDGDDTRTVETIDPDVSSARIFQPILTLRTLRDRRE